MIDVFSEIKKYEKIKKEDKYSAEKSIINMLYGDIRRLSKSQFRIEQQIEGFFDEMMEAINEKVQLSEEYKKTISEKNEQSLKQKTKIETKQKEIESLIEVIVEYSNSFDTIKRSIELSKNQGWILQIRRMENELNAIMVGSGLYKTGGEKYFNDILHEAIYAVKYKDKDFREIIYVESPGYSYKGHVIKKARVVVNNYRGDETDE